MDSIHHSWHHKNCRNSRGNCQTVGTVSETVNYQNCCANCRNCWNYQTVTKTVGTVYCDSLLFYSFCDSADSFHDSSSSVCDSYDSFRVTVLTVFRIIPPPTAPSDLLSKSDNFSCHIGSFLWQCNSSDSFCVTVLTVFRAHPTTTSHILNELDSFPCNIVQS